MVNGKNLQLTRPCTHAIGSLLLEGPGKLIGEGWGFSQLYIGLRVLVVCMRGTRSGPYELGVDNNSSVTVHAYPPVEQLCNT